MLNALLIVATPLLADVKPSALFSDRMVLQSGMAVPVRGTAAVGERVTSASKMFGNHSAVLDTVLGDWQLSGITTYRDGTPIATIAAACNVPNAGTCYAHYAPGFTGPVRINGAYGSGDLLGSNPPAFLDSNAFVSRASFTYGNTPRTGAYGLSNPALWGQDLSLKGNFPILESIALAFQVDAIKAFDMVMFAAPAVNITSANFGRITAAANRPRSLQFSARITF